MSAKMVPIAREPEQSELRAALEAARRGQGGLVLVAGEAGIGKTFLVRHVLTQSGLRTLDAAAGQGAPTPYGPLAGVLRAYLRMAPQGFAACGSLAGYLALLMPELGAASVGGDSATMVEAIHCGLEAITHTEPAAIFLDDLHWADAATLEALPILAGALAHSRVLIIGAYRTDEIPRGHALRRMRSELRRQGRLHEITLVALDPVGTATLAEQQLGQSLAPSLAARLHSQTEGVPFFVEEMAAALRVSGRLRSSSIGLEIEPGQDLPLPESVREAVMLRVEALSPEAGQALEVAAVAGSPFDLDLVAGLAGGEEGLSAALEASLIVEVEPGRAAFRHALIREAVYGVIAWSRRRRLHRQMAEQLEARGGVAPTMALAEHWLAARDLPRACAALLALAERWCSVHAYRDAAGAIQRALEIWPPEASEPTRLDVLDQLGLCAQMSGDLIEAARAWREAAEGRRQAGDQPRFADAQRRLAGLYELQGQWDQGLAARQAASEAFAQSHLPGEAAAEQLAIAAHLDGACHFSAAVEAATRAAADAAQAGRVDLQASALAIKGESLAKLGHHALGRQTVDSALALALEHNLIGPASDAYTSLAGVLQHSGDLAGARDTYHTAIEFCQTEGILPMAQICLACLAVVLREMGDWERAIVVCKDVLAAPDAGHMAQLIVSGMLGSIMGWRGHARQARSLLAQVAPEAQRLDKASLEIDSLWSLATVEELSGDQEAAATLYRSVLQRRQITEECHYSVPALRWAASFFAGLGAAEDTRACARALAAIASTTGRGEAVAALAHALGEVALLDGDARLAAKQFEQALDALANLELPFDRAHIQLRAGVALAAAGQHGAGVERLVGAYHTARKLSAQPLARRAARELSALGETVERRLGRRAAGQLEPASLTPREHTVLHQIALGQTNRDIARELFLSPRTVDMHVRHILAKLDARSRTDAIKKAGELNLLP